MTSSNRSGSGDGGFGRRRFRGVGVVTLAVLVVLTGCQAIPDLSPGPAPEADGTGDTDTVNVTAAAVPTAAIERRNVTIVNEAAVTHVVTVTVTPRPVTLIATAANGSSRRLPPSRVAAVNNRAVLELTPTTAALATTRHDLAPGDRGRLALPATDQRVAVLVVTRLVEGGVIDEAVVADCGQRRLVAVTVRIERGAGTAGGVTADPVCTTE